MSIAETYYQRSNESLEDIPPDEFMALLTPKIAQAISLEGVEKRLSEGEPLNIKFGTDPTGPDLHLGHAVPLRLLDLFNRAGHNVHLLFGDFTAKIGDPSGRTHSRKPLSDSDIQANMSTYTDQMSRFYDVERRNTSVINNSQWLGKLTLAETFKYLQMVNLSEASQRQDFRDRMANGQTVTLAETMYGTLTGIDSVALETDIEVGGLDQLLNFQQARAIQLASGQVPEEIIMTPILEGTHGDGRKMSKSFGNYIAVNADFDDMFGKIMSIPDSLIVPYIKSFAPVTESELSTVEKMAEEGAMELKKQLGVYMVAMAAKDFDTAMAVREKFESRFSRKDYGALGDLPVVSLTNAENVVPVLAEALGVSRSHINRLFAQGAIQLVREGDRVKVNFPEELTMLYEVGYKLKIGKQLLDVNFDQP